MDRGFDFLLDMWRIIPNFANSIYEFMLAEIPLLDVTVIEGLFGAGVIAIISFFIVRLFV